MTTKTSRAARSAADLAEMMGMQEWQVIRARNEGLIPPTDRSKGWSADLADAIVPDAERVRDLVGRVPDWSGWDTADWLSRRFGLTVYVETVRELRHLGHLTLSQWCASEYSGRSLEAFANLDDAGDIIASAIVTGRTLMASQAAERLEIRRADFDHLVRAGLIQPITSKLTGYTSKRHDPGMDLYRQGDVDALAESTDIDWVEVRAVPKGARSTLAKLPTAARTR